MVNDLTPSPVPDLTTESRSYFERVHSTPSPPLRRVGVRLASLKMLSRGVTPAFSLNHSGFCPIPLLHVLCRYITFDGKLSVDTFSLVFPGLGLKHALPLRFPRFVRPVANEWQRSRNRSESCWSHMYSYQCRIPKGSNWNMEGLLQHRHPRAPGQSALLSSYYVFPADAVCKRKRFIGESNFSVKMQERPEIRGLIGVSSARPWRSERPRRRRAAARAPFSSSFVLHPLCVPPSTYCHCLLLCPRRLWLASRLPTYRTQSSGLLPLRPLRESDPSPSFPRSHPVPASDRATFTFQELIHPLLCAPRAFRTPPALPPPASLRRVRHLSTMPDVHRIALERREP